MGSEWTTFEFWADLHDGDMIVNPFEKGPVSTDSVFGYESLCSPLPEAVYYGRWQHFPDQSALAAFLRHMFLLSCFGIWLVREEWDDDDSVITLDELLSRADRSGKCRYAEDIPLMREIVSGIDVALDTDNSAKQTELLAAALDILSILDY